MQVFKHGDRVEFIAENHHTFKRGDMVVIHEKNDPSKDVVAVCDPEVSGEFWMVDLTALQVPSEDARKKAEDDNFISVAVRVDGKKTTVTRENYEEFLKERYHSVAETLLLMQSVKKIFSGK